MGGVFITMNWYQYSADKPNGYPLFNAVLADIANLVAPGHTVNITVSLKAGTNTDCSVLAQTAVPIWNQNANPNPACEAVPAVYPPLGNSSSPFAGSYVAAMADVVSQFKALSTAHPSLLLTGVKLAGLNTESAELNIHGDSQSNQSGQNAYVVNNSCGGAVARLSCAPGADGEHTWLSRGYYPPGIALTWNQINLGVAGLNFAPFSPLFEVDAHTDSSGPFPPIGASDNTPTHPDFNCNPVGNSSPCSVYNDQSNGYTDSDTIGLNFTELVLLQDLLGQVAATRVAVQGDDLSYNSPKTFYQGALTPVACWAYNHSSSTPEPGGPTHIGFQTTTQNAFKTDQDEANYLAGLNRGVQFGAEYEEVFPYDIYDFLTYVYQSGPPGPSLNSRMTTLSGVQQLLISNDPASEPYCKPSGG